MYLTPIHRKMMSESEEVIELPEIYSYSVIANDHKTVLAEAETREEALRMAMSSILLPTSKSKVARV